MNGLHERLDELVAGVPTYGDLDRAATLGPGADELTVWWPDQQAQVIGYDGAVRRRIDLSAVLDESSEVGELAWSPDGGRLAVRTREFSSGLISHIWLVDDDGDAQRVHTASTESRDGKGPLGYIWSLAWSPDGRRLGFIEEHARLGGSEESLSIQAVSLLLPEPGQEGPGTAKPLYDYERGTASTMRPSCGHPTEPERRSGSPTTCSSCRSMTGASWPGTNSSAR